MKAQTHISGLVFLGEGPIPNNVLSWNTLEGFWAPLMTLSCHGYDIPFAHGFLLLVPKWSGVGLWKGALGFRMILS